VAGFTTLVSTTARFRFASGTDGLLRHIGAISEMAGMRYWSTTHHQWKTLIESAWALTDPQSARRRGNFSPDEMRKGQVLYFEQEDNLTGKGVYRMRVAEASEGRIVLNVENVGTVRYLLVTIFHPGDMQLVYFLDRERAPEHEPGHEKDDIWRFYSLVRTGVNASGLVTANEASAINRAVAFYRWMVGIPGDQEPPAAR
jgi:hypothetical protein